MESQTYMEMKNIPTITKLNAEVKAVVESSTWWELHGRQWVWAILAVPVALMGYKLLQSSDYMPFLLGIYLLGGCHAVWANRMGHLASHGSLCSANSKLLAKFWYYFFIEFIAFYSGYMGYDIHIKIHHPHTNVIGLGDSSSWKAPQLTTYPYMFLGPLLVPIITPFVAIQQLLEGKLYRELFRFLPVLLAGVAFQIWLLVNLSNFTVPGALVCLFAYRAVFSIPYIHINIFQHIGLPMFSKENRPPRLVLLAEGVLNLARNPILDMVFGHTLVNCHVEHHLFPALSDDMCLKIKPIVKRFLEENGLPYTEKTYMDRMSLFLEKYEELMVLAPPMTHFVGIQ